MAAILMSRKAVLEHRVLVGPKFSEYGFIPLAIMPPGTRGF
jgi:hypothetical protein